MVKALEGLPVSVLVVIGLSACTVKVSCGDLGGDKREGIAPIARTASLTGTVRVTKSTFPGIDTGMRCKVVVEKTAEMELGKARVNCFEGKDQDGGLVVYSGQTNIEGEERGDGEADDRMLWIDESSDVRARIEYDGKRDIEVTVTIWSVNAKWEIKAEAGKEGA